MNWRVIAGLAVMAAVYPVHPAVADLSPVEVTEEDGSPSTFPYQVKFANGSVTDNGDGTTSVAGGSGAPTTAEYVVTEADGTLSAEVAPSAANQIPNSTSSTAGSWTETPTIQSATLSHTIPSLVFTDTTTSEDDFEVVVEGSTLRIVNTTDGVTSLIHYANNGIGLGEVGMAPGFITLITDGTGNNEVQLPSNSIGVGELDAIDSPADGEYFRFDGATSRGEWSPIDLSDSSSISGTLAASNGGTGITSLGTGVATWLGTPSAANLRSATTGTTGSGNLVFATSPTLTTPDIGAATATSIAIGANTLNTSEWANLDGVDQALATTSSPSFVDLTLAGTGSDLTLQATGADAVGLHSEASVPLRLTNETDAADIWRVNLSNEFESVAKLITRGGADLRGVVDARNATVVSYIQQVSKTVFDPDTVQTTTDDIPLFEVDPVNYPYGIRIVRAKLSVNTNASPTYVLQEWTTAAGGSVTNICTLTLVAAAEGYSSTFGDQEIAAGSFVMLDLDTTALNWAIVTVWFYANTA